MKQQTCPLVSVVTARYVYVIIITYYVYIHFDNKGTVINNDRKRELYGIFMKYETPKGWSMPTMRNSVNREALRRNRSQNSKEKRLELVLVNAKDLAAEEPCPASKLWIDMLNELKVLNIL